MLFFASFQHNISHRTQLRSKSKRTHTHQCKFYAFLFIYFLPVFILVLIMMMIHIKLIKKIQCFHNGIVEKKIIWAWAAIWNGRKNAWGKAFTFSSRRQKPIHFRGKESDWCGPESVDGFWLCEHWPYLWSPLPKRNHTHLKDLFLLHRLAFFFHSHPLFRSVSFLISCMRFSIYEMVRNEFHFVLPLFYFLRCSSLYLLSFLRWIFISFLARVSNIYNKRSSYFMQLCTADTSGIHYNRFICLVKSVTRTSKKKKTKTICTHSINVTNLYMIHILQSYTIWKFFIVLFFSSLSLFYFLFLDSVLWLESLLSPHVEQQRPII